MSPGRDWLTRLESLYIVNLSTNQLKKRILRIAFLLLHAQIFVRCLLVAIATSEKVAHYFGNPVYGLGLAGQIASVGSSPQFLALLVYRWQYGRHLRRDSSFIQDILDYDDPLKETVLVGRLKTKFINNLRLLKVADKVAPLAGLEMFLCDIVLCIVAASSLTDDYAKLVYCLWIPMNAIPCFMVAVDTIYTLGFWLLCKRHLDLQANVFVSKMTFRLPGKTSKNIARRNLTNRIYRLQSMYQSLVLKVKDFDSFSKKIISPCRILTTFMSGTVFYSAQMMDNQIIKVTLMVAVTVQFLASLVFMSTTSSLSIRRRKMYQQANSLFQTAIKLNIDLREQIVLRRMIKSLGNQNRPTICLTDSSEGELAPMEFVEFIASCVSNYLLAVDFSRSMM